MAEKLYDPRLLFSSKRRKTWLREAIVDDWVTGRIPENSINLLLDKTRDPNTDRHLRDVIWCDIAVHYPGALATVAGFSYGANVGSVEWMAGSVLFHFLPKVGPGSVARTFYLAGRAIQERTFMKPKPPVLSGIKESANLFVSLLPYIGHAPVLVRMSKECPEIAEFLLHHTATRDYKIPAVNRFMSRADKITQRFYNRLTDSKIDFTQVPK